MRTGLRIMALIALSAALMMVSAAPAVAAPPVNDTSASAVVVAPDSLPFSEVVDTTEATTDAEDAQANGTCGAPATDASVWYQFTPDADGFFAIDLSGSDYTAGVIVASGTPGNLTTVACAQGGLAFPGSAGQTYWIIAFDDQFDGTGTGGTLHFRLEQAPPPPELAITVDRTGTFDPKTGDAMISGTLTCTGVADFIDVFGNVSQRAGRLIVRGFASTFFEGDACTGEPVVWTASVDAENGLFKGGRADVQLDAFACSFDCGSASVQASVRLRSG